MVVASATPRLAAEPVAVPGEQVYVMHCQPADSVQNKAGFQARATSTSDTRLQDFARDEFPYELPGELKNNDSITPELAPCRLALVPAPGGRWALVHSVLKIGDTRGRRGSYFTHILFTRKVTLRQALSCWASKEWKRDYEPGLKKDIAALPALPAPAGMLNDQALTDFLKGTSGDRSEPLSTLLCPARLPADPARRQRLLRRVLNGVREVRHPGQKASRLYILAEPGLVAILLLGVARLLPEVRDDVLSFTTYEPNNLDLRRYRLADVVGVYGGAAKARLDPEFFDGDSIAVDTFGDTCSPGLDAALPPLIEEMLALAVAGDWGVLDESCWIIGSQLPQTASLAPAQEASQSLARVKLGQGQGRDLFVLYQHEKTREFLSQNPTVIWPLLNECSLTDHSYLQNPLLVQQLQAQLPKMTQTTAKTLRGGGNWKPHLSRLEALLGKDRVKRLEKFEEILAIAVLGHNWDPGVERLPLVQQWLGLDGAVATPPEAIKQLLRPATAQALEQLEVLPATQMPRPLLARAALHGLLSQDGELRSMAVKGLNGKDDELGSEFTTLCRTEKCEESIWPLLRDGYLNQERYAPGFQHLFEQNKSELGQLAVKAILKKSLPEWQRYWGFVKLAIRQERLRLDSLLAVLKAAIDAKKDCIGPELRPALLREYVQWSRGAELPKGLRELLLLGVYTPDEVSQLLACSPAPWDVARLLGHALRLSDKTADLARQILASGDDAQLDSVCRLVEGNPAEALTTVRAMVRGEQPNSAPLLRRLLPTRLNFNADLWFLLLCEQMRLHTPDWHPFWHEGHRLRLWLERITGPRPHLVKIWKQFASGLNKQMLIPGDAVQKSILGALVNSCDRHELSNESDEELSVREKVNSWHMLNRHLENPFETFSEDRAELNRSCQRVEFLDLLPVLQKQFLQETNPTPKRVAWYVGVFRGFYAQLAGVKENVEQIQKWQGLITPFPEPVREEMGLQLVLQADLGDERLALAKALLGSKLITPRAHARITREMLGSEEPEESPVAQLPLEQLKRPAQPHPSARAGGTADVGVASLPRSAVPLPPRAGSASPVVPAAAAVASAPVAPHAMPQDTFQGSRMERVAVVEPASEKSRWKTWAIIILLCLGVGFGAAYLVLSVFLPKGNAERSEKNPPEGDGSKRTTVEKPPAPPPPPSLDAAKMTAWLEGLDEIVLIRLVNHQARIDFGTGKAEELKELERLLDLFVDLPKRQSELKKKADELKQLERAASAIRQKLARYVAEQAIAKQHGKANSKQGVQLVLVAFENPENWKVLRGVDLSERIGELKKGLKSD